MCPIRFWLFIGKVEHPVRIKLTCTHCDASLQTITQPQSAYSVQVMEFFQHIELCIKVTF